MALPPKGHPDRPLRMAARSMMTLGVLLLVLTTCGGISVALALTRGGPQAAIPAIVGLFFWMGPAIGFIVCSVNLKRYRAWAAIVGLVLSGLALLVSLLMLVVFSLALVVAMSEAEEGVWVFIPVAVALLFIAAFTQLIVHLSKSFKAIRIHEIEGPQGFGFVPIMPPGAPVPDAPDSR